MVVTSSKDAISRECNLDLHSIVVPVFNSCCIMEAFVSRVSGVMLKAGLIFELVLVDDGSQDGSYGEMKRLSRQYSFLRGFRLSRNFGHQAALTVGLRESRGAFIAIIDDDLQDPPEMLPVFFQRLKQDADVVYGVRRKRKESFFKRFLFACFYRILGALSKVEIPLDSGDFCAMRRCVVDAMLQMYDANPFLRGFRSWVGFRQVGVEYERAARASGESGYTLRKYFKLALIGILMLSNIPLRLSMYIGLFAAFSAALYTVVVITLWLIKPFDVPGFLSLVVIITFLGGVQLVAMGIIGEYVARLIDNTRRWPVAFIAEQTGETDA